jgi:hypothetical protein
MLRRQLDDPDHVVVSPGIDDDVTIAASVAMDQAIVVVIANVGVTYDESQGAREALRVPRWWQTDL